MSVMSGAESLFCRSAPWRAFARRIALPWALDGDQLSGAVLEIGAGSGAMAEELLRLSPDVALTVVDVDPTMVAAAAKRLGRFGDRATVEIGDATALPYPDASFDTVVSWLMLHHTLDWESCLREARRVLRPGGRLVGYDLLDTAPARIVHRLDRSPHRLFTRRALGTALNTTFERAGTEEALGGLVCRFTGQSP